jgi:hypothetical protein
MSFASTTPPYSFFLSPSAPLCTFFDILVLYSSFHFTQYHFLVI